MNVDHFWELMEKPPQQDPTEWLSFLEFVEAYFKNRRIPNPLVVEVGIRRGNQKRFWTDLLGFQYLGVDIVPKYGPDVLGDSHNEVTRMKTIIQARGQINIVFIDACHRYESVKKDYELWGPLAKDMIVLHDVMMGKREFENVRKLWGEILADLQLDYSPVQFFTNRGRFLKPKNMGIGVLVKWSEKCINHPLMK